MIEAPAARATDVGEGAVDLIGAVRGPPPPAPNGVPRFTPRKTPPLQLQVQQGQ